MDSFANWFIGGGLLTVVAFTIATFWKIGKVKDDVDKRVNRNYERLDEVKDEIKKETVPQRLCDILHAETQKDIEEIKKSQEGIAKKVDCIPAIKLGLDLLLQKNGLKQKE